MPTNVTSIEIIPGSAVDFRISRRDAARLRKGTGLPERCFLRDIPRGVEDRDEPIMDIAWCEAGSGWSWDYFEKKVLPATKGRADLVVTWEGMSLEGLRVIDGVVTAHKVVVALAALGEPRS